MQALEMVARFQDAAGYRNAVRDPALRPGWPIPARSRSHGSSR
jgi:hypothetical protein